MFILKKFVLMMRCMIEMIIYEAEEYGEFYLLQDYLCVDGLTNVRVLEHVV